MARFEGIMRVTGELRVVVDIPGITLREARLKAESSPEAYKCLFVEDLEFEYWAEDLEKTEEDEPDEEE